jgi:hypothetical protein
MAFLRQPRMTRTFAGPDGRRFVSFVAAFAVLRRVIFGTEAAEESHSKAKKFSAISATSALIVFCTAEFVGAVEILRLVVSAWY